MWPYILVFFYIAGLALAYYSTKPFKRKKLLYCTLLVLPLVFLSSFKNLSVGNDTSNYYEMYVFYRNHSIGTNQGAVEKGFGFYAGVLSHLKVPFTLFLLISYTIVYVPIILLMRKSCKYPEMVAYSLLLFQFLNFSISGLRQSIAIGICLYGIVFFIYINNKNAWYKMAKYLLMVALVFIAYFFHKSALIFIAAVIVLLSYDVIKINPLIFGLLCFLAALTSQFIYGQIFIIIQSSYYYDPPSSGFFLDVGLSTYLMIVIVLLCCLFGHGLAVEKYEETINKAFKKEIRFKNEKINGCYSQLKINYETITYEQTWDNMYILFLALMAVLNCLFNSAEVFSRITTYYSFAFGFVLSYILSLFKSKKTVFLTSFVFILIMVVYFYFGSYRSGYLHMFPYKVGFYV